MEQASLFSKAVPEPLAARLRPRTLEEIAGQEHLLGKGKVLWRLIEQDSISSMIFWGPPGVGKTTLAGVIARMTKARFINFSAVTSGIKDIREVMKKAESNRQAEPVPLHLRNAVTKLMKELDYGRGYQYAHDAQEKITNMECLPESLQGRSYYHPTQEGLEGRFARRLREIKNWKQSHQEKEG